MLYSLTLPNGGPWSDARTLGELARLAEQSGWDGVFLEDYIIWQGHPEVPTYDPWIALAAMALNTERIRLGTQVTALARRRPWKVAREAVTLDHLSNGRLILGVGLGDTGESIGADSSLTHFGEAREVRQRAEMLDEALEILAGLWRGEPFAYAGRHYQVREISFLPRPVQQPRIPIWVGGAWPLKGPSQRAARWDGAVLYKHPASMMTPEDNRDLRDYIAQQRGSLQGYDIVATADLDGKTAEEAQAIIRSFEQAGATWWGVYLPPDRGDLETVRGIIAQGPPRID